VSREIEFCYSWQGTAKGARPVATPNSTSYGIARWMTRTLSITGYEQAPERIYVRLEPQIPIVSVGIPIRQGGLFISVRFVRHGASFSAWPQG